LLEFRRVRTEQLAERIVDLEPCDAETSGNRERDRDKGDGEGNAERD
jgi:hypothetical protein